MSSTAPTPPVSPTATASTTRDSEQFIKDQIETTQTRVKLVDLATCFVTMAAGILGFLLVMTLIDHWVWGLNLWARLIALVLLVMGCGAFFAIRVMPGLLRPVNPVYAAQAIEHSSPTLKNGLINFLLLRNRDSGVRRVIYDGVRRQAAEGLSRVDVGTAVDRSSLIRIGYVLALLVIVFGVYRVLSPKDPFQSVARVAAPWKTIARPSRAEIDNVEPGNAEIYQGSVLAVSADVRGLRDDEAVTLFYSTVDGQVVDQSVAMTRDANSHRYECELTTGSTGIQHDLRYHLCAGDARTQTFRITVRDALSINVQQITYQFPDYTQIPDRTLQGMGDLKAVEGTKVRIDAVANQPIHGCFLELFDPQAGNPEQPDASKPMTHEGHAATSQFTLALRSDRSGPLFSAYQLRFSNRDGQRNREPARYAIEVTPDLPPLVELLAPRRREIELPINRSLHVEVRALDPDFALRHVRLHAVAGGLELLEQSLLDREHEGPAVLTYRFVPHELGLVEGDSVLFWAEAEDNRRAVGTNAPEPNSRRTANYRIQIIAADETEEDGPNDDEGTPDSGDASRGEGSDDSDAASGQGGSDGSDASNAKNGSDDNATGQNSEGANDSDQDASSDHPTNGGAGQSTESDAENDPAESADSESDPSDASAAEQASDGSQSPNEQGRTPSSDGGGAGENQEPVASDGSNDADAIRRILDHKSGEDDGRSPAQEPDRDGGPQDAAPENDSGEAEANSSDDPSGPSDKGSRSESGSADSASRTRDGAETARGNDARSDSEAEKSDGMKSRRDGSRSDPRQSNDPGSKPEPRDDARSDDARSDDARSDDARSDDARSDDARSDDARSDDARSDDARSDDARSDDARSDDARSDDARSDDARSDDARSDDARSDDARSDDARSDDARSDDARSDDARSDDARSDDARSDDARSDDARSDDASGAPAESDSRADRQSGSASEEDNASSGSPATDGSGETPKPSDSGDDSSEGNQDSGSATDVTGSQPSSGGQPSEETSEFETSEEADATADDPNLEFARQATDLALEHLDEQQDNRELLDRLGWTPEEARSFLERWRQMRRNARQQGVRGDESRRELDDVIRGLGLKPGQDRTRRIDASDNFRRLRDDGGRSSPPAEYADQYRAYLRSFSQQWANGEGSK